jgi:hypothetical protein
MPFYMTSVFMKNFLLLFCAIIHGIVFAQNSFEYNYKTSKDELTRSIIDDNNGNIYITIENFQYALIVKLNPSGKFIDSLNIYNPGGTCNLAELIRIDNEQFIAMGNWSDDTSSTLWFTLIDNNLSVLSDIKLESNGSLIFNFRHLINSNGNIILFTSYDPQVGSMNVSLFEITLDGVLINSKYFTKQYGFNQPFSIIQDSTLKNYKAFTFSPLALPIRASNNNLDSNFDLLPSPGIYGDKLQDLNTAKWFDQDEYLLTGKYLNLLTMEKDIGIERISKLDSVSIFTSFGKEDTIDWPGIYSNLDFTSNNHIFFAGSCNVKSYPFQSEPSWIMLNILDSNLNLKSQQFYGGDAYYLVNAVLATQDSGCIMACTRFDFLTQENEADVYLIKVNKDGLLVSVPENPIINGEPCFIYPNPGHDAFHVDSSKENMLLQLFDMTGKLQVEIPIEKGDNQVQVPGLPAGIFLYRIIDSKNQLIQAGKWVKQQ